MAGWIYVILSAGCSVLLAHLFKVVESEKLDTVRVLTVNYFIAAATSGLLSLGNRQVADVSVLLLESPGVILLAAVTGVLFITNYFIYSKSVHYNGVGISVAAMRISLIIPVLLSVLWYLEWLSPLQWVGVAIVFVTLFLLLPDQPKLTKTPYKTGWLLILIFVFTGVGDAALKVYERAFSNMVSKEQFMAMVFFTALLAGGGVILFRKKWTFKPAEIALGAAIGIPNLLTAIFLIAALEHLNGAVVYSAVNVLTVLGATILGIIRWGDQFTGLQWSGIGLALLAILLLV